MMSARLSVEGIEKSFGARLVLDGVSLHVRRGECVGILGANGAGKSTLFSIMAGLVRPDAGEVLLGSEAITRLPIDRRAKLGLGYLDQEASVFRRLTVEQNLELALEARGLRGPERAARLEGLLQEYDLAAVRRTGGAQLSGGERRRVEIARALAGDPAFLLLDEPFTGVDPVAVRELQELVRRLREGGRGVLVTDHSSREILAVADRVYLLHEGRILEEGTAESLAASALARRVYLGEPV